MSTNYNIIVLVLVVVLCSSCIQCIQTSSDSKRDLYFSFITALTGTPSSSGGIPVIDFALEQINNDSRLLPDYNLKYTNVLDSKCDTTTALESFFQHFDNASEPTYITSMCCGCSPATIPVAEISHHWNIPQISFSSSATLLNDRRRFKTLFRTLPCYVYAAPTVATIMRELNWRQMAIITEDTSTFNRATEGVVNIFERQGWRITESVKVPTSGEMNYGELLDWDGDYRVIMINTLEVHAYHIVCQAYRKYGQRLLNQEIVLLMHGRYMTEWWETAYTEVNSSCTREEVMTALNKTFAMDPATFGVKPDSTVTFSGITPTDFLNKMDRKRHKFAMVSPQNFLGNAYDAMWVVAYGLDLVERWAQNGTTISECEDNYPGELVRLHAFNHTNRKMGCYMKAAFHQVDIVGITGPIRFRPEGNLPENVMRLRQHRVHRNGSDYVVTRPVVARIVNEDNYDSGSVQYANNGSFEFTTGESHDTIWPGGVVPYDGSTQDVLEPTHLAITIAHYTLGIIGLVFTTMALVFNLMFRNKRVVKLGSPNLNFLIIIGAALLYSAMFFYATSAKDLSQELIETVLCNFRMWLFTIGNALCFGVVLAKQWRIYYIFSNPTAKKKAIKDWMLVILVAAIVGIDLTIVLVGTAIPESRITANTTLVNELRQIDGINERVFVFVCSNSGALVWIAISFGYKALLQLGAIFMAFTTRKVKVKGLNDTKEIYTTIYINTVIITVLIVTEFALRSHREVYITLYGLAIFAEATLFLALIFLPRVILLRTDPEGNNITFQHDSQLDSPGQLTSFSESQDPLSELTIQEIDAKIEQLQKKRTHLVKRSKEKGQKEKGQA